MARTLTCSCGQVLDVEGFQTGQQVRCPQCNRLLAVPAAEPEELGVAMATAIEDEDEAAPEPSAVKSLLTPMERRRRAQMRSDYAAQSRFRKIIIWPSLVLGLLSLVTAGLGFYWAYVAVPTIQVVMDKDGTDHLYARVLKEGSKDEYEKIEVQPDIYPGDRAVEGGDDFVLGDQKPAWHAGAWVVPTKDGAIPVMRRGLWFYEVDTASDKNPKDLKKDASGKAIKVNVPLVAMTRTGQDPDSYQFAYMAVRWNGEEFVKVGSAEAVPNVTYYRLVGGIQDKPIEGNFAEGTKPPLGLPPVFFIIAGLPIAVILLLAGGFFAYQTYFSKAARKAAERAAEQSAQAS